MDRGPDSGLQPLSDTACRTAPRDPVVCDQAIYTSVRSISRQGYGMVASSSGIQASEIGDIVRRAPSVGGLCVDDPGAVGVSFFGLGSGRYAALHTRHAGREPSGRGDRRTYTRIFVLDARDLCRFRNNAFALLRAAEVAGGLNVEMSPEKPLQPLTLIPCCSQDATEATEATEGVSPLPRLGARSIGHVVETLISGGPMVIDAGGDVLGLTETLVSLLPAPLRLSVSFSAGLPFTMSRDHRLVVIPANAGRTGRCVEGTPYSRVDLGDGGADVPACHHPWARACQRWLTLDEAATPAPLLADRLTDADMASIERIGELWTTLADVRSADLSCLADTIERVCRLTVSAPLERELADDVMQEACTRSPSLMAHADEQSLVALWQMLAGLTPRTPQTAGQITSMATCTIGRMSELSPIRAMETLLDAAEAQWSSVATADLADARDSVISLVTAWIQQASDLELCQLQPFIESWCQRFPDDKDASDIRSALADCAATSDLATENSPPASRQSSAC